MIHRLLTLLQSGPMADGQIAGPASLAGDLPCDEGGAQPHVRPPAPGRPNAAPAGFGWTDSAMLTNLPDARSRARAAHIRQGSRPRSRQDTRVWS